MILPDTSVWIDFFRGRPNVYNVLAPIVDERKAYVLECVFGELLQGVRTEKEARLIQEYWHHLPQVDETGLWLAAGYLGFKEKLLSKGIGIVDAAILMAARKNRLRVWTFDKKLLSVLKPSEIYSDAE